MSKYIVWFNGEYDIDENGYVFVSHVIVDSYELACEFARDYERATYHIATVESYVL